MVEYLIRLTQKSLMKESQIMAEIDDLEANVAAETGAIASITTLLSTIHKELLEALAATPPDIARIQALADKVATDTTAIVDAVLANPDPAAPPVVP